MPANTFERFDGGLDVRQLASSSDANRLRTLKNAYVNIKKSTEALDTMSRSLRAANIMRTVNAFH